MARAGTLTLQPPPPPPHPAPDGANTTFDALVGCAVAIARWYRIWDWRANLPVEPLAPALVAIRRAPQNNPALHCEDGPPLLTPSHVTEANLEATTERLASALAEVDQLTTSPPACSIS